MEQLRQESVKKNLNYYWQDFKRQYIRSTIALWEPVILLVKYPTRPGKKSPLKDLWNYINAPYPDSLFEDPEDIQQ